MSGEKRVVFVAPGKTSSVDDDGAPVQKLRTNMCLPAATVLGALDAAGFETHFIDLATEGWGHRRMLSDHLMAYGLSGDQAADWLAELNPRYVLITSMFTFEQLVVDELVRAIRRRMPDVYIVLGGIHASVRPEWHFEESGPDFIVLGEGEETVIELLLELEKDHSDPSSIPGIAYRCGDGQIHRTPRRERLRSIDRPWCLEKVLRRPDGGLRYIERMTRKSPVYAAESLGEDMATYALYASRGCPYGCSYCPTLRRDGATVRHMGAERMFRDFLTARQEYGAGVFYSQADTFGYSAEDRQFLRMVRSYRRKTGDSGFVLNNPNAFFVQLFFPPRLKYALDTDLVDLLAEAGVNVVTLAVETCSPRFNRKIDWSRIRPEHIAELCRVLHAKRIKTDVYMMYGFPDQEQEEFDADLEIAERLLAWADSVTWHFTTLLPGTAYYDAAVQSGRLRERQYRAAIRHGYSFFYPIEQFNLSCVDTRYLKAGVTSFGPAWV